MLVYGAVQTKDNEDAADKDAANGDAVEDDAAYEDESAEETASKTLEQVMEIRESSEED